MAFKKTPKKKKTSGVTCDKCGTLYHSSMRKAGDPCGESLSKKDEKKCTGVCRVE